MPQLTAALPRAPLLAHRPVRVLSHPAELADSWDQLAIGSGSPMHHYAWVSACAELFSKPGDVHLVVLGSPEDPAAIAPLVRAHGPVPRLELDRKSTRLNSSHGSISYAVFCLKKKRS